MTIPYFNNTKIQLFEYVETHEEDFYGEKHHYKYQGEYPADIQPLSPDSQQKIFGKILQDTYKMYLAIDVPIKDTYLIKIPNEGTFEIVGSVETWNHGLLNHKKVILKKHRKEVIHYESNSES